LPVCVLVVQELKNRLSKKGRLPSRKAHKLTQYKECKDAGLSEEGCYKKVCALFCAHLPSFRRT
jgi:hypothetical protein